MLRAKDVSRVLFPALMEAGAGNQKAVVVIVMRRYAGLMVVASIGSLSFSVVTMMTDYPLRGSTVTVTCFCL